MNEKRSREEKKRKKKKKKEKERKTKRKEARRWPRVVFQTVALAPNSCSQPPFQTSTHDFKKLFLVSFVFVSCSPFCFARKEESKTELKIKRKRKEKRKKITKTQTKRTFYFISSTDF